MPTIDQITEVIYATMPLFRRSVILECASKINALYEDKSPNLTLEYLLSNGWKLTSSDPDFLGGYNLSKYEGSDDMCDGFRYTYELYIVQYNVRIKEHREGGFFGVNESDIVFNGKLITEKDFNYLWDLVKVKHFIM